MSIRQASLIALLALLPLSSSYGETRLDMAAIVKEVEILKNVDSTMTMVMWMPEEYWRAAIQSTGKLTDKGADEFLKAMRPYTMFAVLAADTGPMGAFTYSSPDQLRKNIKLEDSAGAFYEPLDPQTLNGSMKNLLQLLRPILTNAMGPMGTNMEIVLFPATTKAGTRIADATHDGYFIVHLNGLPFRSTCPWAASCRRWSMHAVASRSRATTTSIRSPETSWCPRRLLCLQRSRPPPHLGPESTRPATELAGPKLDRTGVKAVAVRVCLRIEDRISD